ncbi:MAG: hypothetical protein ACFFD4_35580, partial [Candidatus Odinarchaeota archaeon]
YAYSPDMYRDGSGYLASGRIYYYINQLVDDRIIEESETEKLTNHMSRRKFKITNWFIEVFAELDKAFHDKERENLKAFHLFQIHFAITILTQQARLLEKIPENEFSEYINKLDLPYQQFFFADRETLPLIKNKHQETSDQIYQKHRKYKTMVELIKNSTHITIFGTYLME